jgi:hypothetical protein
MTHGEAQPAEEAPPTGGVVLPILIYTYEVRRFGKWGDSLIIRYFMVSLFSREKTCKV